MPINGIVRSQLTVLVVRFSGKSTAALSNQAKTDRPALCHVARLTKEATSAALFEFRLGHNRRISAYA